MYDTRAMKKDSDRALSQRKKRKDGQFIVKVQIALAWSHGKQPALVYNEDRSVMGEMPVSRAVLKAMDGAPKAFFYAKLRGTELELLDEAPWQDW